MLVLSKFKKLLWLVSFWQFLGIQSIAQQSPIFPNSSSSAFELYFAMLEQSVFLKAAEIKVNGHDGTTNVTFGGEKEGSSKKILRVMSLNRNDFFTFLLNNSEYAFDFLDKWQNSLPNHPEIHVDTATFSEIKKTLIHFLEEAKAPGKNGPEYLKEAGVQISYQFHAQLPYAVFSVIPLELREEIFTKSDERIHVSLNLDYKYWVPLLGEAARYIMLSYKEQNGGWEIVFKPQPTYADFEKQMLWFRQLMGSDVKLFEAPGHQRVVMPINSNPTQQRAVEPYAAEINRILQAYLAISSLQRQTKALNIKYNVIHSDSDIAKNETDAGLFRLEKDVFYDDSWGVEFRSGMKNDSVRRFVQAIYASRLASGDYSGIKKISDWKLISTGQTLSNETIAKHYDIDPMIVQKAKEAFALMNAHRKSHLKKEQPISELWLVPTWQWLNAPFLQGKKAEIRRLTIDFLEQLGSMKEPTFESVEALLSAWAKSSNIISNLENYVTPKRKSFKEAPLNILNIEDGKIDVNKIDLGFEYTARLPVQWQNSSYRNNSNWISTFDSMTAEERENKIKSLAETLKFNLTGSSEGLRRINRSSQRNVFDIIYTFTDSSDRLWTVELNSSNGDHSSDGGHLKVVTPNYQPTYEEIQTIFNTFEEQSVVPDYEIGGSVINIDLSIFKTHPKAMSRFLEIFHKHKGIISLMFQHMNGAFQANDGFTDIKGEKLEFKLFAAPADAVEAALQQLLIRAMLNVAVNETKLIGGTNQQVDFEKYLKNPQAAYDDLNQMAQDLKLDITDYMPYVISKILLNRTLVNSKSSQNLQTKIDHEHSNRNDLEKAKSIQNAKNLKCENVML